MRRPAVVACGGGHGLAASLGALRHLSDRITAVVTVADDGGSSGRIREAYDVLPPGDLRMALAALCDDSEWGTLWSRVLQHRFPGSGELAGHAVGNLLIVALWQQLGNQVEGLDMVGRLLGARGRVLPMAQVPLQISADIAGTDPMRPDDVVTVRGQANVAVAKGEVQRVHLHPSDPPVAPDVTRAVLDADWVILGPGSWYTSVMPHLLVPQLRDALCSTSAHRLLTLNLQLDKGETAGYTAERHLQSLHEIAPELQLDAVLADPSVVADESGLRRATARLGAELVVTPVATMGAPDTHDVLRLAAAYRDIFS